MNLPLPERPPAADSAPGTGARWTGDTDQISDGYHTFGELYAHRAALLVCLMSWHPHRSWYALRHTDGTMIEGFFLAGMELPTGQISYHLRIEPWYAVLQPLLREYDVAPLWDGHTSADVLQRITAWTGAHARPRSE